jgi:hypothetical protein
MTVVYMDTIGVVSVEADHNCIQFIGGEVYFSNNYEEYRLPVAALIEIYE